MGLFDIVLPPLFVYEKIGAVKGIVARWSSALDYWELSYYGHFVGRLSNAFVVQWMTGRCTEFIHARVLDHTVDRKSVV